jgi:dTDP-4-amino-4,6-dideoxygalactose transaminase
LSDAAQSFGAQRDGRKVGTFGLATATSFFPAKPLGCYGDGGAVTTDDDELASLMRSLRVHGQGSHKYDNVHIGMAARLDTIQAAVLLAKLTVFESEIEMRQLVADRYTAGLSDVCIVPRVKTGATSVWAQYTVRIPAPERERVVTELNRAGVPANIYYPIPLHRQKAYSRYPQAGPLAVTEQLCQEVLSLPMHPYLDEDAQSRVIAAMRASLKLH